MLNWMLGCTNSPRECGAPWTLNPASQFYSEILECCYSFFWHYKELSVWHSFWRGQRYSSWVCCSLSGSASYWWLIFFSKIQLTPLLVCRFWRGQVHVGTVIPTVIHVCFPRHSKSIQSFPTDDTRKWNSWKSILSNTLNDDGSKFSIGPGNETSGRHPFSFRLVLKSSDETTLCTAAAITRRGPIRDGDCETTVQRRCTRYTLFFSRYFLLSPRGNRVRGQLLSSKRKI